MSTSPWPQLFVVRPEVKDPIDKTLLMPSTIVPLIPVDELPDWFEIVSVPRVLSIEQTGGMYNVGTAKKTGTYDVQTVNSKLPGPPSFSWARDAEHSMPISSEPLPEVLDYEDAIGGAGDDTPSSDDSFITAVSRERPSTWKECDTTTHLESTDENNLKPLSSVTFFLHHPAHIIESVANAATIPVETGSGSPAGLPRPPTPSTTQKQKQPYCVRWCRTGNCIFGTACRHQHVVPQTVEELHKVGISQLPDWWARRHHMDLAAWPIELNYPLPQGKLNPKRSRRIQDRRSPRAITNTKSATDLAAAVMAAGKTADGPDSKELLAAVGRAVFTEVEEKMAATTIATTTATASRPPLAATAGHVRASRSHMSRQQKRKTKKKAKQTSQRLGDTNIIDMLKKALSGDLESTEILATNTTSGDGKGKREQEQEKRRCTNGTDQTGAKGRRTTLMWRLLGTICLFR
ncbi:hypothetical protein B0H66DRAFT_610095 [Apodospora peruviana]|uniref:C3H1-type domain-containing protein n=1 Tax=Apodospora peruviana TaxID=516989 RepID=A0AAE0IQG0_9PEZI|nr:hypothetical protein B0H66DRAFT_610095 [Apodospora peruviana]